jgi:hypothetical protein
MHLKLWCRKGDDEPTDVQPMTSVPQTFTRSLADYGGEYKAHILEQYKLFVETEERLVSRRQDENRFFLSINALIVTVLGVLVQQGITDREASLGIIFLAAAGTVLCWAWHSIIDSYKDLNTAKFVVIKAFEQQLPARMFGAEWDSAHAAGYQSFTTIEKRVPYVFGVLHLAGVLVGILGVAGIIHSG